LEAVARAENGQVDADLGGGVIKQRIERPGQGKSGGYRTIIVFRQWDRAVFMYGYRVGAVDTQTMRRFDEACLTPVQSLTAKQIKALREREHVSQTVFANYLNVTPNLVSKWERGERRPSGPALKLLSLVEKHGLGAVA